MFEQAGTDLIKDRFRDGIILNFSLISQTYLESVVSVEWPLLLMTFGGCKNAV